MPEEIATPEAQPADTRVEFKVWRSLDKKTVLIRVGYNDLELSADAAVELGRLLLQAEDQ